MNFRLSKCVFQQSYSQKSKIVDNLFLKIQVRKIFYDFF